MDNRKLHIALISYEFPPDIGKGGVATYTEQVAVILQDRGHITEVFCGSLHRTISEQVNSVAVHRLKVEGVVDFREKVVAAFAAVHAAFPFDVIESPEINANGIEIKRRFPDVPLVVKLHTPSFMIVKLNRHYTSKLVKLRFFLGALRRGRIAFYGDYRNKEADADYQITALADVIVSPSVSLKKTLSELWDLEYDSIQLIPNPYQPNSRLLSYPVSKNCGKVVTFTGKLNEHKGIVNLVKAIPAVIKKHPDVLFRFIGEDGYCSIIDDKMSVYIKRMLQAWPANVELTGGVAYPFIVEYLGKTEICIFPSVWENFPMVCLEAMSAGCAVIGSREGGMAEMLSEEHGILINPQSVTEITNALLLLLGDSELRIKLGTIAREKVLKQYNPAKIGHEIERCYLHAIEILQKS